MTLTACRRLFVIKNRGIGMQTLGKCVRQDGPTIHEFPLSELGMVFD